jgi:hypothetical protein
LEVVDWIHLIQDRGQCRVTAKRIMKLRVQWKAGNFLTSWVTVSFSRRTLLYGVSKSCFPELYLFYIVISFLTCHGQFGSVFFESNKKYPTTWLLANNSKPSNIVAATLWASGQLNANVSFTSDVTVIPPAHHDAVLSPCSVYMGL